MLRKFSVFIAACVCAFVAFRELIKQNIHIAFVAAGNNNIKQKLLEGVEISIEQFNKMSKDKKIILHIAKEGQELDKNVCAVIAHESTFANPADVPVLSPLQTSKLGNAFNLIYDANNQAEHMCLYAKYVLKHDCVDLIYSNSSKSMELKEKIVYYAGKMNLKLGKVENVNSALANFKSNKPMLFATEMEDSVMLLKKLDHIGFKNNVIGNDVFMYIFDNQENKLVSSLNLKRNYQIFATVPVLKELLNENGKLFEQYYQHKFNKTPGLINLCGYNSGQILCDKLNKIHAKNKYSLLLRHALEEDCGSSIDDSTDKVASVYLAKVVNDKLEAFPVQLKRVSTNILDLPELIKRQLVLKTEYDAYFYRTHIVWVGVDINNLLSVDFDNNLCLLDLYFWLRYDQNFHQADNMIFLNSTQRLRKTDKEQFVEKRSFDGQIYELYRIRGNFYLNAFPKTHPHPSSSFYDHVNKIGVTLRHQTLDSRFIRYAQTFQHSAFNNAQNPLLSNALAKIGYLPVELKSYEDIVLSSGGVSAFNYDQSAPTKFSRFSTKLTAKKIHFSIFSLFDYELSYRLMFICLISLLLIFIIRCFYPTCQKLGYIEFLMHIGVVLSLQFLTMSQLDNLNKYKFVCSLIFDIFWWFMFGWVATYLVKKILWSKLEARTQRSVPALLYACTNIFIYLFSSLGVVAFVLGMPITSLLTSISLLGLLVIMAIKMNVTNVFSGFFLNIEGQFREGDWVRADQIEGKVIKTYWRSTVIECTNGEVVNIPNAKLSQMCITNFNYPNIKYVLKLDFTVSIKHQPEHIIEVVEKAIITQGLVEHINVFMLYYDRFLGHYQAALKLNYYNDPMVDKLKASFYAQIWKALHEAGVGPGTASKIIVKQDRCL